MDSNLRAPGVREWASERHLCSKRQATSAASDAKMICVKFRLRELSFISRTSERQAVNPRLSEARVPPQRVLPHYMPPVSVRMIVPYEPTAIPVQGFTNETESNVHLLGAYSGVQVSPPSVV